VYPPSYFTIDFALLAAPHPHREQHCFRKTRIKNLEDAQQYMRFQQSPVLVVDLSDHSRFITADAALERNPLTTSATTTKTDHQNRTKSRNTGGDRPRSPGSLCGYDDASAGGAKATRRSTATSSAETALAVPPLAAIGYTAEQTPVPKPPTARGQEEAGKVVLPARDSV
jgi:hypothetical protein